MKKLVYLGACLVALASLPVKAQSSEVETIVVKVVEYSGLMRFAIARPGSKPEYREFSLKQLKEKGEGDYLSGQAEYTRSLLIELAQQGYTLTTTYTTNGGPGSGPTTLVFTKRQ